jgi:hypothetical protein
MKRGVAGTRSYRTDAVRLAASLAAALMAVFAPFLIGQQTLLLSARDVASVYPAGASPQPRPDGTSGAFALVQRTGDVVPGWLDEPSLAVEHRLLLDDRVLPAWDPYDAYGTPFAASMQPQPFHPLTALLALAPNPVSYDWFIVARLFLAGLGAALFARLFVGFRAALAGGLSAAFGTYFLIFYAMPHLSVETLLPLLLLAVELAVRRAGAARVALLAAVGACTIVGGFPESTALAWATAAAYAALRLAMTRSGGATLRRAAALAAAALLAVALSAVLMLPFAENLGLVFDAHQPANVGALVGLVTDPCRRGLQCLVPLAAPLVWGPPANDVRTGFVGNTGVTSGFGVLAAWLAAVALAGAVARRRMRRTGAIVFFFAATVVVLEAKRFGFPPVQWIGTLPVLRLVYFYKYGEAVVVTAVAILVAFGVAELGRVWARRATHPLADVAALAFAAFASAVAASAVTPQTPHALYTYGALAFAIACFAAGLTAQAAVRGGLVPRRVAQTVLVAIVGVQAAGAYAIPVFFWAAAPVPASLDPYAGAPYVAALRDELRDGERVFGSQGALRPEWNGAFGLPGISIESAMWPLHYVHFVRAFSAGLIGFNQGSELDLDTPLAARLFRLSSVRYVVAPSEAPLPRPGSLLTALRRANERRALAALPGALAFGSDRIGARAEPVLTERPPQRDVAVELTPPAASEVRADAAIPARAYRAPACAAPVRFTLSAERDGRVVGSASRVLDVRRYSADRGWSPLVLSLRAFARQAVLLRFSTEALRSPAECRGAAEWGDPRIVTAGAVADGRYATAAHDGVHVIRFSSPLARAHVVRDVRAVADDDAAMRTLTAPDTDVARTAVIDEAGARAVPRFAPCTGGDRVEARFPRAGRVEVAAELACPGLLVLNDAWNPGWRAALDGRDVPIVRADVLFQGIAVPAGRHAATFVYAPRSVALGAAISLAALAVWFAVLCAVMLGTIRAARAR